MQLISVNIGQMRAIANAKSSGMTGIYKLPVTSPVVITANGIEGDAISDVKNHGGVDQAIYVYGEPDYRWWSQELGYEIEPGVFGENLTISEMASAHLAIGDIFHIDDVTLQVTSPRIPCVTLAARMGDPAFVKRFRAAERPGLYCRVLREGTVQVGATVVFEPYSGETIPAIELFKTFYEPDLREATLRRHLAAPVGERVRRHKEEQLRTLLR
ncbi:MAG: MOSC domain-containing protein [Anaerolineales bacterium]|nr:MOSC domain-containing protein [Anaerolineales bacterium]